MSTSRVPGLVFVTVVVLLGNGALARAQNLGDVRLRLDPTVASLARVSISEPSFPPPLEYTHTVLGLFGSSTMFGVGFSASNHVNFGAAALLAFSATFSDYEYQYSSTGVVADPANERYIAFAVVPYAEYVFGAGSPLRGFLAAHAGARTACVLNARGDAARGAIGVFGLSAGAHYFLNEHVSIDPSALLTYSAGSVKSYELSVLRLAVLVGVSVWLGDTSPEPETPSSD